MKTKLQTEKSER